MTTEFRGTVTRISIVVLLLCSIAPNGWCNEDADLQKSLRLVQSLVENHCIDCHSGDDKAGEFDLEGFDTNQSNDDSQWETSTWEKITKRMRARQMPPPDADRPTEKEYVAALAGLEGLLERQAERFPKPGRTESLRRLNRTEYKNAVRDLLSVNVDVTDLLPADQLSHGFDNVTVGELSPVLLNRYISAAEQISRLAVGGSQRGPGGMTVRLPPDRDQESHVEGLPLGTRGGTTLEYQFPADGEYEIQLRLARNRDENIEGLKDQHDIDVLIDRDLIHRFSVSPPKAKKGWAKDDTLVDANLKKRFSITAGPHQVGVTFPQKSLSLSENRRQPFDTNHNRHRHPRLTPAIYEVSIIGPFDPKGPGDTPSRRRVFSTKPKSDSRDDALIAAEEILRPILRSAYRRPVNEADLSVPMRFFSERFDADGFERGIESALAAILVNPHFLFRCESDPDEIQSGEIYRISNVELASRLSFLIWSSIPDAELLAVAQQGQLHDDAVLRQQVTRMLADPKSDSLVSNFAVQWLYLRNLDSFEPDLRQFADFDDNLRKAMRGETEALFRHVMRNDLSVLKLIDSDKAFLNERLARHYGISGVLGSHFRPVTISDDPRGGLLRHGSILAVTSYATRTSPTVRGNWILENILGTPPPPPPPNVPSLKEKTAALQLSVRQRLALHRENPACASCHNLMDPVGFALENFDSVGRWRVFDDGIPIDSAGELPDGQEIDSVAAREAGIIGRPEMFVGTMTEKLLTFALGRGVELQDGPAIRKIVSKSADKDFRFSSIIQAIAQSKPFQYRSAK